jgi:aryl-alcohol dehydrogenase-like predicted oxidoreductase
MEQIKIGATDIVSSRIALGTWAIGGWMWGGTDESESIATIQAAVDRGITMIDTAPAYGFGRSEEIVGQALAEGGRRDRVLIATKVGLNWQDGQVFRDASATRMRQEIEDSLRRLRTDASTCTRCTGRTRRYRSRKPPANSIACSAPARSSARRQQFRPGADGAVP